MGYALFTRGMVSSQSGNLSICLGERLIITRRGASLGAIEAQDLIETGVDRNDRATPLASVELPVHRAIYRATSAKAIVHAHPPYSVALSLAEREITPGLEWADVLGMVPVVGHGKEVKPGGLADDIANALKEHRAVVVRGHGSFVIGQYLEEALNLTTALEESSQVLYLARSMASVDQANRWG